jgi:hypothetical protein
MFVIPYCQIKKATSGICPRVALDEERQMRVKALDKFALK